MWTSLQPFYLQPIVWMTHLADYQLWGMNAMGHHATNWLLHGIYVALVGTLVWLLTGAAKNIRALERLAMSAGIALVCGIHPLQVESCVGGGAQRIAVLGVDGGGAVRLCARRGKRRQTKTRLVVDNGRATGNRPPNETSRSKFAAGNARFGFFPVAPASGTRLVAFG